MLENNAHTASLEINGRLGALQAHGHNGRPEANGHVASLEDNGHSSAENGHVRGLETNEDSAGLDIAGLEASGHNGSLEATRHVGSLETNGHMGSLEVSGDIGGLEGNGRYEELQATGHIGSLGINGHNDRDAAGARSCLLDKYTVREALASRGTVGDVPDSPDAAESMSGMNPWARELSERLVAGGAVQRPAGEPGNARGCGELGAPSVPDDHSNSKTVLDMEDEDGSVLELKAWMESMDDWHDSQQRGKGWKLPVPRPRSISKQQSHSVLPVAEEDAYMLAVEVQTEDMWVSASSAVSCSHASSGAAAPGGQRRGARICEEAKHSGRVVPSAAVGKENAGSFRPLGGRITGPWRGCLGHGHVGTRGVRCCGVSVVGRGVCVGVNARVWIIQGRPKQSQLLGTVRQAKGVRRGMHMVLG
jgi:hypothetical protein